MLTMRFAILADVHLGTRETQFPGQDLTYAADLLRRAVTAIKAHEPEEVVVVGDLVNMGTVDEYELSREILRELRTTIKVVPGNHELVRGNLEDFRERAIGGKTNGGGFSQITPGVVWLNSGIED